MMFKSAFPMATDTMLMSMQMEMPHCAEWKAR